MTPTLTQLNRAATGASQEPDGRLLDAFTTSQNEAAFAALVERHGPMVLAVCRRSLRHHQDAEDAFQATFLVLARRAGSVWPRDAVGSWLYGVAHKVALKARTARTRRQSREHPLDEAVQPVARDVPPTDLTDLLDRAIRKLPEVYRAAIVACDLEGRSRQEAADHLGWKEGTLSGRLARARQLLASRLRRSGLSLPAGGVAAVLGAGARLDAGRVAAVVQAAGAGTGVVAPVVALTEGVLRGMLMTKIQSLAVVVLTACLVGLGVWCAGAGDEPGGAKKAAPGAGPPVTAKPAPDLQKAQGMLGLLHEELKVLGAEARNQPAFTANSPEAIRNEIDRLRISIDRGKARLDVAEQLLDRAQGELAVALGEPIPDTSPADPAFLQGSWRITSRSDGKSHRILDPNFDDPRMLDVEIRGDKLIMPYLDLTEGIRRIEYTITRTDPTKSPPEISIVSPNRVAGYGIYNFTRDVGGRVVMGPNGAVGLRLAIGPRGPKKFGEPDEGGVEFTLKRITPANPPSTASGASGLPAGSQKAADLSRAQAATELEVATANFLRSQNQVDVALRELELAKLRLAKAEEAALSRRVELTRVEVRYERRSPMVVLTAAHSRSIEQKATAVLQSACGEMTTTGKSTPFASTKLWDHLQNGPHVRVAFPDIRQFEKVGNNPSVKVQEFLIPTPDGQPPDYILTRTGDTYRAFFDFQETSVLELKKLLAGIPVQK